MMGVTADQLKLYSHRLDCVDNEFIRGGKTCVLFLIFTLSVFFNSSALAYDRIKAAEAAGSYYGSAVIIDTLYGEIKCKNNELLKYKNGASIYVYRDILSLIPVRDRYYFEKSMPQITQGTMHKSMIDTAHKIYNIYYKKDRANACMKTELIFVGIHTTALNNFYASVK